MPFAIRAKIDGLKELNAKLKGVEARLRTKVLREVVGKIGRLVMWAARSYVPVSSGLLKKSLGHRVKVYRNKGVVVCVVGPRKGFKRVVTRNGREALSDPVRYAHLVELGTRHSAAKPFLAPALASVQGQAKGIIADAVNKFLSGGGK